jgi:hypothetical protein
MLGSGRVLRKMAHLPGTIARMYDHRISGRLRGWLRAAPLSLAILAAGTSSIATTGCRVTEDDLHRWESTQRGPDKIRAVLKFPKYATPLRVEAALSLIRMKPRGGRSIGVDSLVETLAEISPDERSSVLSALVPVMIAELKKPPPPTQAGQAAAPDGSFAFKDAAHAMLTYEKQELLGDSGLKGQLKSALVEWAMADFERRLENRSQKFGMEQLLRMVGSESVLGLPKLITRDSRNLDKIAQLVSELGNDATKEAAGVALVDIAKYVVSDEWTKAKTPVLEQANKASKLEPTPEQFKMQLASYQDEELLRTLGSIKRIGGRSAVDFCLAQAADAKAKPPRRAAMLAAIELRLDPKKPEDIQRIFAIALGDSPPEVIDQAFRRIGEMPRDAVASKLYESFSTDKWKVRRSAASVLLRMSTAKHLDEFMGKLPDRNAKGYAMPEAITYGATIADLKEGDVKSAAKKYLAGSATIAQRTVAASYFLTNGVPDDVATLAPFEGDSMAAPVCESDPECKWACYVVKDGAKDPVLTDIKTFGDYVKHCVQPAIAERAEQAKKEAAAKTEAATKKDEKK